MAAAGGIDLGTTNSVIAATEAGKPAVIPNAEGSRTTPSVVAFTEADERLVGQLARRQAILNPQGTIYSAKRFIGRRYDEVASEREAVSFDVVPGPDGAARFEIRGKQYAISESSNLGQAEVDRLIAEAERHQEEDRRLRELTDARNQLDSAAYQVERRLSELGPSAPTHEKARAEALISDARQAIEAAAPLDQLRSLTSDLQQVYHGLAAAQPGAGSQAGPDDGSGQGGDDDVIDAEFTPHE